MAICKITVLVRNYNTMQPSIIDTHTLHSETHKQLYAHLIYLLALIKFIVRSLLIDSLSTNLR